MLYVISLYIEVFSSELTVSRRLEIGQPELCGSLPSIS